MSKDYIDDEIVRETEIAELEETINHLLDTIEYSRSADLLDMTADLYKDIYEKAEEVYIQYPSQRMRYSLNFYRSVYDQYQDILKLIKKQRKDNKLSDENKKILKEIKAPLGHHLNKLKDFHDARDYQSAYESAKQALKLLKIEDKLSPTYETKYQIAKVYQDFVEIYVHYSSPLFLKKMKKAIDNSTRYALQTVKLYRGKESLNLLSESYRLLTNYYLEFRGSDEEVEEAVNKYNNILRELKKQDKREYLPEKLIESLLAAAFHFSDIGQDEKAASYFEEVLKEVETYIDKYDIEDSQVLQLYDSLPLTIKLLRNELY